ncbi:MAG TPA: YMGG-like glycine zipper-containing protein [Bryobacteraceae bacterium]|nr:YMGG-like glycine zipper-containing protein [Bryobacteraceae bacterium]
MRTAKRVGIGAAGGAAIGALAGGGKGAGIGAIAGAGAGALYDRHQRKHGR